MTTVEKLNTLTEQVCEVVHERSEVVQACIYALVTQNHAFLYGPPGTAKSLAAKLLTDSIQGSEKFYKQLTRQMTEEAVFGPLDIPLWRSKGEYKFRTEGGLAEAEIAVLEEYFDASDALIRSMNELLNERVFSRSLGHPLNCPLHTAIATSNFWRAEGDAQAVSDRFLCRVQVFALSESESRQNMVSAYLRNKKPKVAEKIQFSEIKVLAKEITNVSVGEDIIELYDALYNEFKLNVSKDAYLSDRRVAWSASLIQASAVLNGRAEAEMEDLGAAKYGLVFVGNEAQEQAWENAMQKILGQFERRIAASKELHRFRRVFEQTEHTVFIEKNSKNLVQIHQKLMQIRHGLTARIDIGDMKIDKGFKKLRYDLDDLITQAEGKIKPEELDDLLGD